MPRSPKRSAAPNNHPDGERTPVEATASVAGSSSGDSPSPNLDPFKGPLTVDEARALDARYEALKTAPPRLVELQRLELGELQALAARHGLPNAGALRQPELVFELMKFLVREDGLAYGEGVLEILPDGFGFLRSPEASYLSSPDDIYVSPSQIRRFGMKPGQVIQGQIRPPKPNEKFFALLRVEAINSMLPEAVRGRPPFDQLTPTYPHERLRLEIGAEPLSMRIIDLMCPIGKGQRGLVVAPPRTGKTILLKEVATSILKNHPEVLLMILLIDERPEEVTDIKKSVNAEVISSTFDETTHRHLQVAEIVLQKAKRAVE